MLGAATGILAFVLLILVMLPPLRLTWIERTIAGLPRAYRLHHVAGILVVVVGALHAGLAMSPYLAAAEGPREALALFFDASDPLVMSGSLALVVLTATVVVSAWRTLPRRIWIWLHRLALPGFGLAAAHVLIAWSDILAPGATFADAARVALGVTGALVIVALGLHFLRPEWLATHRELVVAKVEPIEADVVALTLRLGGGRGAWRSGQFGFFRFDCKGPCGVSRERHPFTVVDTPGEDVMRIVVKALGDDTTSLQRIVVGTSGEVSGPYGALEALLVHPSRQVWLAGGLGVLPFLGLVRRMFRRRGEVALIYLYRPGRKPLFMEELLQLAASRPWLRIIPMENAPDAAIEPRALESIATDWRNREWAIAGPHAMIERWTTMLRAHGVPKAKIYTEDFLT